MIFGMLMEMLDLHALEVVFQSIVSCKSDHFR